MTVLFVAIVIVIIVGVGMLAAGRFGALPDAPPDHRPQDGQPQFDIVLRGYRMDEVDATIAALRRELDQARGEPLAVEQDSHE